MTKRIGPSVWARAWNNLTRLLTKESSEKIYVGEDNIGNRFYEYKNARSAQTNIHRGYEALKEDAPKPTVEWEAWLKGTRRFPPSDEEIALNRIRQQKQLEQDTVTEKRAPYIGTTGKGAGDIDRPKQYPTYDDLEMAPGARKPDSKD